MSLAARSAKVGIQSVDCCWTDCRTCVRNWKEVATRSSHMCSVRSTGMADEGGTILAFARAHIMLVNSLGRKLEDDTVWVCPLLMVFG